MDKVGTWPFAVVTVVTGGRSVIRGSISRYVAEHGATVVIISRDFDGAKKTESGSRIPPARPGGLLPHLL